MSTADHEDRRTQSRIDRSIPVAVTTATGTVSTVTSDLSLGGLRIDGSEVPGWFRTGDVASITLVGDDAAYGARGEVVHTTGDSVGLRFCSVPVETISYVRRTMELNTADAARVRSEIVALASARLEEFGKGSEQ